MATEVIDDIKGPFANKIVGAVIHLELMGVGLGI